MFDEVSKRPQTARITTISSILASTFTSCDNIPNVVLIDTCERFVSGEQTCYCVNVCAISTNSRTGSINSVVHGLKWCWLYAGDNFKNIFLNEKMWRLARYLDHRLFRWLFSNEWLTTLPGSKSMTAYLTLHSRDREYNATNTKSEDTRITVNVIIEWFAILIRFLFSSSNYVVW